jgi:hypothetical protein
MEESMKKFAALLLITLLTSLVCIACVTKNGNNNLDQGRRAAVDATRRMDNALGE